MDPRTRWQAIDSLFHAALEREPGDRAAFLAAACAGDERLRAEVEAMVEAAAPARALAIERLVDGATGPTGATPDPIVGLRLGPWQVTAVLGHGGMGTVYLAERADGQYSQRVALKLVPGPMPGVASGRFAIERAALARLAHPNIAHLIDAGQTPEGSPYIVMELVDGAPITTACDARAASVDERLRLFHDVCVATQHAHQALVVHRDLKPSNIFVTRGGAVKLLDFGIAKLLEPEPDAGATDTGWHALTPAYAAPEQLRGQAITTATDVYVLGAVLYELLAGVRPAREASTHPLTAAPSAGVAALDQGHQQIVAAARGTTPIRLRRELTGDLDRIVLKAMETDPARRYGSAGQLADDLARWRDGRPVLARPDSFGYRARRFLARHRWASLTAAAFVLALAAFAVTTWRQGVAVAAEKARAERQTARAERVSRLLADLFTLAGPAPGRGEQVSSRELLDHGAARIAAELAGDPATQAQLFTIVGRVYGNLSLHARGVDVLVLALGIERQQAPGGSLAQAETLHRLGELLVLRSDFAGAEARLREALAMRRAFAAPEADVAETLVALGRALGFQNQIAAAAPYVEEAVNIRRRQAGVGPADLMSAVYELGMVKHRGGDLDTGERLLREAVDLGRGIVEPVPAKVEALMGLARLRHQFQRDAAGAEPVYREALALARALYPSDHQDVATVLGELARDVRDQGRLAEAEALVRDSLTMFQRLYGAQHREVVISTQTLASIQREQGQLPAAEATQREALAAATAALGAANPLTFGASRALAAILEAQGRMNEAFSLRAQELRTAVAALGEHDVYVAIALAGMGAHCLEAGRAADAVGYFQRALDVRTAIHPAGHKRIDEARAALVSAQARAGARASASAPARR